jgi:uncharacterized protein
MPGGNMVADLAIKMNGLSVPLAVYADVRSVTVHDDIDALSMFTIELNNWDPDTLQFSWSDSRLFAVGGDVQISLGYMDEVHPVMSGEIVSLEPTFSSDRAPALTVRGYDHRHRLGRGRKTRSFSKMKDSAIAQQVATGAGLIAKVTDTKVALEHVSQANQSDLEFLRTRARLIGYEVFVRDKTLFFRPPQHTARPAHQLQVGSDLAEFAPRLSTLGQVGSTSARGWDVKKKQAVVSKATSMADPPMGTTAGPRNSDKAFGKSERVTVDTPLDTSARGDQLARGSYLPMALSYIEGEAEGPGVADLQAGTVVQIGGAGKTFSGSYYVTSVVHTFDSGRGYRTAFYVRRNAA